MEKVREWEELPKSVRLKKLAGHCVMVGTTERKAPSESSSMDIFQVYESSTRPYRNMLGPSELVN